MTFKNFWRVRTNERSRASCLERCGSRKVRTVTGMCAALMLTGALCGACRLNAKRVPTVDVAQPGWVLRQGQAVWRPGNGSRPLLSPKQLSINDGTRSAGGAEIAGEVLVGTNGRGEAIVQFSKPPFTLVMGRLTADEWEVEFPSQNKRFSGKGNPPKGLVWMYLPRMLAGLQPPANWGWRADASGWKLENRITGEFVEGYFSE